MTTRRLTWTLFDYGVGNLHSLKKAVEATGRTVQATSDPEALAGAEAILLPGVGAFGAVMRVIEPARAQLMQAAAAGRPILGICIGMQILYDASEEAPGIPGLGVLAGTVVRLPATAGKVPHMGWNDVVPYNGGNEADRAPAPNQGTAPLGQLYYVHSYAAPLTRSTTATTTYGMPFAAAVRQGNTVGLQFHPEKSSTVGAMVLADTLESLEQAWGAP
jgi:glutamine amidotransferase